MLMLFVFQILFTCGDVSNKRASPEGLGVIGNFSPIDIALSGISPGNSTLLLGTCLAQENEAKFISNNSQQILDSLNNETMDISIRLELEKSLFPLFPKKIDSITAYRASLLRTLSSTKRAKKMWDVVKYLAALSLLSASGIYLYRVNRLRVGADS